MVRGPWDCINKCVLESLKKIIEEEDESNESVEGRS